jgi:hypothetical protein
MRGRFTLILKHQVDITRLGLRLKYLQFQTELVNSLLVLSVMQRVPRPSGDEVVFFRVSFIQRVEIAGPPRLMISSHKRGTDHAFIGRSARIFLAYNIASPAIFGVRPGFGRVLRPATPPRLKRLRKFRTVPAVIPSASEIRSPVQPRSVNKITRTLTNSSPEPVDSNASSAAISSSVSAICDMDMAMLRVCHGHGSPCHCK